MEKKQPFFSIIIPTYARPQQLSNCLQSLTRLDYPCDLFEVIVVDDGSEIPPESVVACLQRQLDIRLLSQPHAGPAKARNTGASQAKGKFLAFTDDDCTPASDWLKTLEANFAVTPDGMIGGQTLNQLPSNPYSTASQILIDYLYRYYNTNYNQARFFTSNNIALPLALFEAIGGFDNTYLCAAAEDRELCDRWLAKGYPTIYAPEARIYHAHQLVFKTFCRQHFYYGRGAFYFRQVRSKRTLEPMKLEPLSFYLNLLIYPLFQKSQTPKLVLIMLLIISQVAQTVGFLWERAHQSNSLENY